MEFELLETVNPLMAFTMYKGSVKKIVSKLIHT